jgi:toxin-antitoxin system PIN domain toxin
VIIPDVNLLIYAHDLRSQFHARAKTWWEDLLNGERSVGLTWAVIRGFMRITTQRAFSDQPLSVEQAQRYVADWLACSAATMLAEGPGHWTLFSRVLKESGVSGALISDAVLATFAIEYRADLHSNDLDFARFSGFRWVNPLQDV